MLSIAPLVMQEIQVGTRRIFSGAPIVEMVIKTSCGAAYACFPLSKEGEYVFESKGNKRLRCVPACPLSLQRNLITSQDRYPALLFRCLHHATCCDKPMFPVSAKSPDGLQGN